MNLRVHLTSLVMGCSALFAAGGADLPAGVVLPAAAVAVAVHAREEVRRYRGHNRAHGRL